MSSTKVYQHNKTLLQSIARGAHIVRFLSDTTSHHGIYLGNSRVAHLNCFARGHLIDNTSVIFIDDFWLFADEKPVTEVKYGVLADRTMEDVAHAAEECANGSMWHETITFSKSEEFVEYCATGSHVSEAPVNMGIQTSKDGYGVLFLGTGFEVAKQTNVSLLGYKLRLQ